MVPTIAPLMGPHILLHSIGGPAWNIDLLFIPGNTSIAGFTPTRKGFAVRILWIPSLFADSILALTSPAATDNSPGPIGPLHVWI
jgi:hypothetical protein